MKRLLLVFSLLSLFTIAQTAVKDTITVESHSMPDGVNTLVITPGNGGPYSKKFPVLYLLHGHGGNHLNWAANNDLESMADQNQIIIVCPDGKTSWYWDSPVNPELKYETFISAELPVYIDSLYPTDARRESRAITGLSMGGHGAMWNAMRHTDVFGAAGSMSGGVDIRPFPNNWNMKDNIGPKDQYPDNWENYSVINQTDSTRNGDLAIIIDCGYDDFFFDVNNAFHKKLVEAGIGHDYIVRPGRHDWRYWRNAIYYQMMFFKRYFDNTSVK